MTERSLTADDIAILPASMKAFNAFDGLIELTAETMEEAWAPRLSPKRLLDTIETEFTFRSAALLLSPKTAHRRRSPLWRAQGKSARRSEPCFGDGAPSSRTRSG